MKGQSIAPTFRDGLATDYVTDAVLKSAKSNRALRAGLDLLREIYELNMATAEMMHFRVIEFLPCPGGDSTTAYVPDFRSAP